MNRGSLLRGRGRSINHIFIYTSYESMGKMKRGHIILKSHYYCYYYTNNNVVICAVTVAAAAVNVPLLIQASNLCMFEKQRNSSSLASTINSNP